MVAEDQAELGALLQFRKSFQDSITHDISI